MNKKLSLFVIVAFCSLGDILMINNFLSSFLHNKSHSLALVAILISVKKLSRLVLDIPLGIISYKIGLKNTLVLSRFFKLFSLILLLFPSQVCMWAVMILYAAAHVSFYGKFEIYIYNFCNLQMKDSIIFRRAVSICYAVQDMGLFLLTILGIKLFHSNQTIVIVFSIATVVLCLLMSILLPKVESSNDCNNKVSIAKIIANLKHCLTIKKVPAIIVLFSVTNAMAFTIPDLLQFATIDNKEGIAYVTLTGGIASAMMSIGCVISIFLCKSFTKIFTSISTICMILLLCIATNIFINSKYTLLCIMLYIIIYPTIETLLESILDNIVSFEARTSVASIATTLSMICGICGQYMVVKIARYMSYSYALSVLYAICILILCIIYKQLKHAKYSDVYT